MEEGTRYSISTDQICRDWNQNRNRDFARITGCLDTVSSIVTLILCTVAIVWEWLFKEEIPFQDPVFTFAVSSFPRIEISGEYAHPEIKSYAIAVEVSLFLMYTCRLVAAYALLTGTRSNTPTSLKLISCKLWMKTAVVLIAVSAAVLVFGNHSRLHQCILITELVFRSLGFYYVVGFILDLKMFTMKDRRRDLPRRELAGQRELSLIYKFSSNSINNKNNNGKVKGQDSAPCEINVRSLPDDDDDSGHGNDNLSQFVQLDLEIQSQREADYKSGERF